MDTIIKMFEHLDWANLRILESLKTTGEQNSAAKRLLSHTLLAEEVWFNRIKGLDHNPHGIWTELSLTECSNLMEKNKQGFSNLLMGLSEIKAEDLIVYKNSTGKEFSTSVKDILIHVALHGQYHRGQINRYLREEGFEPVHVDKPIGHYFTVSMEKCPVGPPILILRKSQIPLTPFRFNHFLGNNVVSS
ncbi:DinB family protein [Neobacillus drentensis]|uniref:DinB family protein n=1 Tax=Neobacillus drentensis TaxID=220684 RepID=UPI00300005C6